MLVAFDFDGAFAKTDPYIRLGEQHGTAGEIAGILDRMNRGDIDHETGLRSVADYLEGLPTTAVEEALADVGVKPTAPDLLADLHGADHHVAVVSDAPERAIRSCTASDAFDVDSVVANRLPTANDALTGDIEGPLLGRTKAAALDDLVTERNHSLSETVAVGTDRRDLSMLQAAETSVALDPTPIVEAESDQVVPSLRRVGEWFESEGIV